MAPWGQALSVTFTAFDASTGMRKTGDSANMTTRWIKDGTSRPLTTTTVTEIDSSNAPGEYKVSISSTEATCDYGTLTRKISTANVEIIPVHIVFEQMPTAAAGASGGLPTVDGSNYVAGIQRSANNLNNLDAAVSTRLASSAYTAALSGSDTASAVWDALQTDHTTAGTFGLFLDAAISSRSTYAGGDTSGTTTLLGRLTSGRATALDYLDAAISSRLAAAPYTAPDNADIASIKSTVDTNLDATVRSRSTYAGGAIRRGRLHCWDA